MEDVAGRLLDNLLDNLDRLYDRLCTPADTHALLLASAAALEDTELSSALLAAAAGIQDYERPPGLHYHEVMRDDGWNQHALTATNDLRLALASR